MSKNERALRVSAAYHDERRYSNEERHEEIRFQKKKNMCNRVKMAGKLRGKTCMDWLKCLVEKVVNGQECKTKPTGNDLRDN